jgi:hypothetical protein
MHLNEIFEVFFLPWYDQDDLDRRLFEHLYPDFFDFELESELNRYTVLPDKLHRTVLEYIRLFEIDARRDYASIVSMENMEKLSFVAEIDAYWGSIDTDDIFQRSDQTDSNNEVVTITCRTGALIGAIILETYPNTTWFTDWPVWDSFIFNHRTARAFPVFHWVVKRIGDEESIEARVRAAGLSD